MNIIIYEDQYTSLLFPFCINHAAFEIKAGLFSNIERVQFFFDASPIYLIVRNEIEDLIKEKYPDTIVNPDNVPPGLCLNGSIIWEKKHLEIINNNDAGFNENRLYFLNTKTEYPVDDFFKVISNFDDGITVDKEIFKCVKYLWDLFKYSNQILSSDMNIYKFSAISSFPSIPKLFDTIYKKHDSAFLVNKKNIIINQDSELKTGVIIDATEAPVIIGKNVVVDIGSLIQGPVFIDDNSYIAPGAKIRPGTFIGRNCKVGGEVSNSVIFDNSNKVHDGFLGDSFIGEWVNVGAGTNNSNLKNNYGNVNIDLGNGIINTNKIFLGVLIGDYTRVGISTMLNTGTFIGIGCNVFGSGFQKKYTPSFSWGKDDVVELNKLLETCNKMKERRNKQLSKEEISFLESLYKRIN